MNLTEIPKIRHANSNNFFLLCGPCAIEGEEMAFEIAERIYDITSRLEIPWIFKGSYRKANRSRLDSFTGIGDEKALEILQKVGRKFDVPVVTDIHSAKEAILAAHYVDVLQIPAFLCRQTDLLVAAAKTGKLVNIKKGQFLAPWDMKNVAAKVSDSGNDNIILTDRGTSFGYNTLISDMRGLQTMSQTGYPVIIDATHSIQQPGGQGGSSGGQREFVPVISRAAIAVGIAGVFMEVHQDPDNAPSDGPCMVKLNELEAKLTSLEDAMYRGGVRNAKRLAEELLKKEKEIICNAFSDAQHGAVESRWTAEEYFEETFNTKEK